MGVNLAADFLAGDYLAAWEEIMAPVRPQMKAADSATRSQIWAEAKIRLAAIRLPPLDWVVRHVKHAIAFGGEDCIGLGGDLDGITFMPSGMIGIESYPRIVDALAAAGLTSRQIEKVCWRNMLRVFCDVLN